LNSIPTSFIAEFVVEEETTRRDEVTRQKFAARDGWLEIPDAPGLSVELHEEEVERFRVSR